MSADPVSDYLDHGFMRVPGMSSALSGRVTAALLRFQSESGVFGPVAEIGVYEGRFFIALALCARPGEACVAIDPFTWPDPGVHDRFLANGRAAGLDMTRVATARLSSATLSPAEFGDLLGAPARFVHIDGDHKPGALLHDLALAADNLAPRGLVCIDDMLHPLYPELTVAAADFLASRPDMAVLAVIDRESFQGACKYLVARRDALVAYETFLASAFSGLIKTKRADFRGRKALILAAAPATPALSA